jgi:hypothetical protein
MRNAAASAPVFTASDDDAAISAYADMLRGAIERVPQEKRAAVLDKVSDLLARPKAPQRGKQLLNNVYELFKSEPKVRRSAAEVIEKLGITSDPKPVYNAINYLYGARILSRVGYGLYRLADGSIVEGPPG